MFSRPRWGSGLLHITSLFSGVTCQDDDAHTMGDINQEKRLKPIIKSTWFSASSMGTATRISKVKTLSLHIAILIAAVPYNVSLQSNLVNFR
jgi:hypothetical protein